MKKDIYQVFENLVKIKSDTGTTLEKDVEKYIYDYLKGIEYFKKNPNNFGMYKLSNEDYFGRSVVWGLVKGSGRDTIIFINHHDVVDSFDYGTLKEYAYDIDELKKYIAKVDISQEVRNDLESDEWLFGRGTCDMKAGGAIQLYLVKEYSKEHFNGNILFLSVPDEENLSAGMREAVNLISNLKDEHGLEYKLLINSEPHQREIDSQGILYEGSVGKLMPQIYVKGKKTHVGDIFDGLNPALILSEIVKRVELNPIFSDVENGEITPPPSWINFRDKKERYDVSIPESAGGYFSVLTLNTTPKDILESLTDVCREAFEESIKHVQSRYDEYNKEIGLKAKELNWKVNVRTFEQIYTEAISDSGDRFLNTFKQEVRKLEEKLKKNEINLAECGFELTKKTLEFTNDNSPVVVISFSPPYYPHISNCKLKDLSHQMKSLSESLNEYAKENFNETYIKKNYFMGISDMSYTGLVNSDEIIPYIEANMPLLNNLYTIPLKKLSKLNIPCINIGPWGKDLHKFTERVNKRDLLERTPMLIKEAVKRVIER